MASEGVGTVDLDTIVNLDDLRDGAEITLKSARSYTELADEEAEGPNSGADEAPSTTHV